MKKNIRLFPIFLIIAALIFIIFTFAIPGLYTAEVLSLNTDVAFHWKILDADVVWNGQEYKVAYCIDDGEQCTIPLLYNRNIYWASLDAEGNLIETAPLIDNPDYAAEHPTLLYTGVDYILLWVQTIPAPGYCRLHATIINPDGNIISDKIITNCVTNWLDPITEAPGKYAAVWDIEEEALYIVYAESNPRYESNEEGSILPPESLVFSKLYRANNQLYFVTFYDKYMLTRKKLLVPLGPVFMGVAMVKTENHLAVVAGVNPGSPVPFLLLNHKGDIIKKDATLFGANNFYPSLHWKGGEGIILGYVDQNDNKYKIKNLLTDDPNSITLQSSAEITNITVWDNPTLLRKDNGHLSLVWKGSINQDKAIYTIGYDENLNEIVPAQSLKPPYNMVDLSDYYLANGTGENAEFALVYTRKYWSTTLNLLRYDFQPIAGMGSSGDDRNTGRQ